MAFTNASTVKANTSGKNFDIRSWTEKRIKDASERGYNSTRVWMDSDGINAVLEELESAGYSHTELEYDQSTDRRNIEVSW